MQLARSTDPWEQLLEEPDVCYSMFQSWLLQPALNRAAPNDTSLAAHFRWSERAQAYDQSREIPGDPKERVAYAFEKSTRLACIGVNKLLRVELESPELQMDPRLLLRLLQVGFGIPAIAAGIQPGASNYEIPEDTPQEEIDTMIKLLAGAVRNA